MLGHWLHLFYLPHIGSKRFLTLIDHFIEAQEALNAPDEEWKTCKMPAQAITHRHTDVSTKVERALKWSEKKHNHIILFHDGRYPCLLKEIPDPPPLLFLQGDPTILNQPQLAIVGSRRPTLEGENNAFQFAKELANIGFTITSGLALGIDANAHNGALASISPCSGKTIAVLGTGLQKIYPQQHQTLAQTIIHNGGALISEFPLYTPPIANNFPRRNRLIAGMSLGTLVVEAAPRSGSLITARLSIEFGREVFAIPSSIHNPQSKGTHQLIRSGAILVESRQDICEELSGWLPPSYGMEDRCSQNTPNTLSLPTQETSDLKPIYCQSFESAPNPPLTDSDELMIISALNTPKSADELTDELKLGISKINNLLLMLEINGYIENMGAGRYQKITGKY